MRKKSKKIKRNFKPKKKKPFKIFSLFSHFSLSLSEQTQRLIFGFLMVFLSLVSFLSFFDLGGRAGKIFFEIFYFLVGKAIFFFPILFLSLAIFSFFLVKKRKDFSNLFLASVFFIVGASGIFSLWKGKGGVLGKIFIGKILNILFGSWLSFIICFGFLILGVIIFWQVFRPSLKEREISVEKKEKREKKSIIREILSRPPQLKLKEVSPPKKLEIKPRPMISPMPQLKITSISKPKKSFYSPPPFELLEKESEIPTSGDIKQNSAIIKKTLQNFGIPVEMGGVNIGPTVTQYTFKPAEGIKLSKITTLSNDLALALASHPIRIEAPIPGKSLVGVEVPNKIRAKVRLRELIKNPLFQNSWYSLPIVLGRDVSGNPVYTDLEKMPHLLVAGATGSGKTLFLNSILLSLLYRPPNNFNIFGGSPEIIRLILVDPKRVEFPIYNDLPHLLCSVIYNAQHTVNVLKWLITEMERRFDVLSEAKARDIRSYNEKMIKNQKEVLPYIILIIDELADLMAFKGREMEAGIVKLAQKARAVGIHLIVATQRPSVEVITGLIKANITARVAFQVASQVDSRTILDMGGAEKLIGRGDFLFFSPELGKPKRIQAPFISEKEIRKVVSWISLKYKDQKEFFKIPEQILIEGPQMPQEIAFSFPDEDSDKDPLYEEAKKIVIEAKKASASLLQRRLRIGYARAARLLDILEKNGIVGPPDGSKPREVLIREDNENKEEKDWQNV